MTSPVIPSDTPLSGGEPPGLSRRAGGDKPRRSLPEGQTPPYNENRPRCTNVPFPDQDGHDRQVPTRQQVPARRRSAAGHRPARRGLPRRPAAARRCSAPPAPARRSRRPTSSPNSASRRWSCPTTRRWPPSSTRSSAASSRATPSTTSSATTTTTSPKPTSRSATSTSRKTRSINENIDRLRLAATSALVSREDVIIVASVSCIYGLGSPSDYKRMMIRLRKGETVDRDELLLRAGRHSVRAQRRRLRRAASSACAAT